MNAVYLRILTGSAAVLYVAACVLSIFSKRKKSASFLYPLFWTIGSSLSASVVALNFIKNGYAPFVSMYQVLVFLALCFGAAHLYMIFAEKIDIAPFFAAGSAIVSVGVTAMNTGSVWHFPPALQSPFFIPHVICYMIAYSFAAVALAVIVASFTDKSLHKSGVACVRVLFPFMTAGLFLGAIWANEVWGAYWSWDIKECWSLFTWLCYACALHFEKNPYMKKFTRVFITLGFTGVITTFFFVNMMNANSPHVYS